MKASEVATELRRIANALDNAPDLEIEPYFSIDTDINKEKFIALAKIMPRPMEKGADFPGMSYEDFKLSHSFWKIKIARSAFCILKEPARTIPPVYECSSIFAEGEEDALAESVTA